MTDQWANNLKHRYVISFIMRGNAYFMCDRTQVTSSDILGRRTLCRSWHIGNNLSATPKQTIRGTRWRPCWYTCDLWYIHTYICVCVWVIIRACTYCGIAIWRRSTFSSLEHVVACRHQWIHGIHAELSLIRLRWKFRLQGNKTVKHLISTKCF